MAYESGFMAAVVRVLRGMVVALRWIVRSRGAILKTNREWVLQQLGITKRLPAHVSGTLRRQGPDFESRCQALVDPPVVPAAQALHMRQDDVVLGLELNGEARAYPWWILSRPHVANDIVGERPALIVLCDRCSTGVAFDPVVEGRRLSFRPTHRYNSAIALEDVETGSVWAPYLAEAIRGPLTGIKLELLPLVQMEWHAWRELHPDTKVLTGDRQERDGHSNHYTMGGPLPEAKAPHIRKEIMHWDERLPHNTLVLGVVVGSEQRAYPLTSLEAVGGVANDVLGPVPILVVSRATAGSYAALAFSRMLDDHELTFDKGPYGPVDRDTGSQWSFDGKAVAGPLTGKTLSFIPSHVSDWFAWAAHYPEIDLFEVAPVQHSVSHR